MKRFLLLIALFCLASFHMSAQEKIVGEFQIIGNKRLKLSVIEHLVKIKENSALDSNRMEEDIKRLKRLPALAHAYYIVENKSDSSCKVRYHVEENYTLLPIVNFYRTDRDELAFALGLNEANLLGYNLRLASFYKKDVYSSYGINFMAPNSLGKKLGFGASYQSNSTLEPIYLNGREAADYKYTNNALEILGLCDFDFKNNLQIGLNVFSEKYNYQEGATDPLIPLDYKISKLLYKFVYTYDNLDYHFQYISGFKNQFNFQYVTPTSRTAMDFLIGYNDLFYYKRIKKKANWANRLRIGTATNNNSPFAPFAIDNNMNVRGIGNTADRGTAMISLNTELRQTILDKKNIVIQGNLFVDAATLRKPGNDFKDLQKRDNLVVYPGIGLRLIHKKIYNAILRIDYGSGIFHEQNEGGLVFGLGQYF